MLASVDVEQIMANEIAGQVITLYERSAALLLRAESDDDRATQVATIREVRGILKLLTSVKVEQEKETAKLQQGTSSPLPELDAAIAEWIQRTQGVTVSDGSPGNTPNSTAPIEPKALGSGPAIDPKAGALPTTPAAP
jgi:hypothetical protein